MINKTEEKRIQYEDNLITCNSLKYKNIISYKWYYNYKTIITEKEVLNHHKTRPNSTLIPDRIKSALEYEDYIANTYGQYGLIKYDISYILLT